ncbi:MAG: beta family protein [Chloroflexota bacterium]|nr:beta family protein [Chloroflexota bacterium]
MKTLRGEFEALAQIPRSVRERLTPLIEPTMRTGDEPPGPRSILARAGSELSAIFGIDRPFFIDPRWLSVRSTIELGSGIRRPAMQHVLRECSAYALPAIPVFGIDDDPAYEQLIEQTIGLDRGACIRVAVVNALSSAGRSVTQQLERRVDALGVSFGEADLFLDLGHLSQDPGFTSNDLIRRLRDMDDLEKWRTVILAGTVVPPDLRAMPEYTVRELKRLEWDLWSDVEASGQTRRPTYGDYLIQHPQPPMAEAVRMKANIRYSTRQLLVVVRGSPMSRGGQQYRRLARMLTARSDFDGPATSWADAQIDGCARGIILPTTAQQWRAIGTARHLQVTANALAEREAA